MSAIRLHSRLQYHCNMYYNPWLRGWYYSPVKHQSITAIAPVLNKNAHPASIHLGSVTAPIRVDKHERVY